MRIVVALGGNALLRRGQPLEAHLQEENLAAAAAALASVIHSHDVLLTHGNGPQVGLLALQTAALSSVKPYPLDVLGAETEGMIGYVLERELRNELIDCEFATLLTQIVVDLNDPGFLAPSKPIGPQYDEATARTLAAENNWTVAPDGPKWRRVVPSPRPKAILGLASIRRLLDARTVVICAGGGGIPVAATDSGRIDGVEAVIDKDAASALLAKSIDADLLMLLTDVSAVMTDFGRPTARALKCATPSALSDIHFAAGSMGPKIDAAIEMARCGKRACVGNLRDASLILRQEAGTWIVPDRELESLIYW